MPLFLLLGCVWTAILVGLQAVSVVQNDHSPFGDFVVVVRQVHVGRLAELRARRIESSQSPLLTDSINANNRHRLTLAE